MKGFDINDFVIDKVFKQLDKKKKSSKKSKKSNDDYYDPRDVIKKSSKKSKNYSDDPTSKFLRDPKELAMLLLDEKYLDGPLVIDITL